MAKASKQRQAWLARVAVQDVAARRGAGRRVLRRLSTQAKAWTFGAERLSQGTAIPT
jgi:hypothetical protein